MPVVPTEVIVHPLVLLSVVDHYNRASIGPRQRVVGCLLGEIDKNGRVDVTNSYAVPFDEEERNPKIWFLDHDYHETMFAMFQKVNIKEKIVGWYSTGPKIRSSDIDVHEVFRRYNDHPVLVVIDVKPQKIGIPTKSYISAEEVTEDGKETRRAFQYIPSSIEALEVEEVGVEHLLRDVKDASVSTLATDIKEKVVSLHSLETHISEMEEYLSKVVDGTLPINHTILNMLQDIFNYLPNLTLDHVQKAFSVKTNDMSLVIYLSSMIRSVIALHNLINNKIHNKELETSHLTAQKDREQEKHDIEELIKEKSESSSSSSSSSDKK